MSFLRSDREKSLNDVANALNAGSPPRSMPIYTGGKFQFTLKYMRSALSRPGFGDDIQMFRCLDVPENVLQILNEAEDRVKNQLKTFKAKEYKGLFPDDDEDEMMGRNKRNNLVIRIDRESGDMDGSDVTSPTGTAIFDVEYIIIINP